MNATICDVAVIGAGLAGLVAAAALQRLGYRVVVVEKSRGLGGRLATRRLGQTWADHGVRSVQVQGERTQELIAQLSIDPVRGGALASEVDSTAPAKVLHRWSLPGLVEQADGTRLVDAEVRYVSETGMTAIAKSLSPDLEIWRGQRVTAIQPETASSTSDRSFKSSLASGKQVWNLTLEPLPEMPIQQLQAGAIALTIPAPQALALLEPLVPIGMAQDFVELVRSVEFDACLTAIARYPKDYQSAADSLPWGFVQFAPGADLDWVGNEGSKQQGETSPVFVFQSSASFAATHFEAADLQAVGKALLQQAANTLVPWFTEPEVLQVHRWRYAFVRRPLSVPYLLAQQPLPLVCGGDWCGGGRVEDALKSGAAIAQAFATILPTP